MKSPIRVTVSLDEKTFAEMENMRDELNVSGSELVRRAIRSYAENKDRRGSGDEPARDYAGLLDHGEHVILDVDHWMLFLKMVECSPSQEEFWSTHRGIARSHADQLSRKIITPEDMLRRLETCNFFKLTSNGAPGEYTLLTGPGIQRRFIKEFLDEIFAGLNFNVEIKEDYSKIRVALRK